MSHRNTSGIANWRKSTFSTTDADCVEYGSSDDAIGFCDTKQAGLAGEQPAVLVPRHAGRSFLAALATGAMTAS